MSRGRRVCRWVSDRRRQASVIGQKSSPSSISLSELLIKGEDGIWDVVYPDQGVSVVVGVFGRCVLRSLISEDE